MILNKKLKTLLVLALYIGFTIAIYAMSAISLTDRSRRFICCMQY